MAAFPGSLSRVAPVASRGGNVFGKSFAQLARSSSASCTLLPHDSVVYSARGNSLFALRAVLIRATGRLFCRVFNSATNGNGCDTLPDTLGPRRRDIRCYTSRWFCPGDSPHHLTAA